MRAHDDHRDRGRLRGSYRPHGDPVGFALVTYPLQHIVVPIAFVGVVALAGPRGGITWGTLGRALLIPPVWVAYTLARGALVHQYPYGFVNVWRIGYVQVTINIVAILIGALLFMAIFAGIDWIILQTGRTGAKRFKGA